MSVVSEKKKKEVAEKAKLPHWGSFIGHLPDFIEDAAGILNRC
jgi:hypothetical protein